MKRFLILITAFGLSAGHFARAAPIVGSDMTTAAPMLGRNFSDVIAAPVKLRRAALPAKVVALAVAPGERDKYLRGATKAASLAKPLPRAGLRHVGVVFAGPLVAEVSSWQAVAGGHVSQLRISSAGAEGIRAQLQLPLGLTNGELRVVGRDSDDALRLALSVQREGRVWTNFTEGDTQIIEIFTPQNIEGVDIKVVDIVHFDESILRAGGEGELAQTKAGACNVDVACGSGDAGLDIAIAERKKSIARMNFVVGTNAFLCTGTLLNSAAFPSPLLLTANHCVQTQEEASTLETVWFRENATCGASDPAQNIAVFGQVRVGGGADLLLTNAMVDSTLLRLRLPPPSGVIFSGWNPARLALDDAVVSISHPTGAPMKYALGRNNAIDTNGALTGQSLLRLSGFPLDMYAISFTRGVIEGGSSGSGIFTRSGNQLLLRGVLSNSTIRNSGGLSCTNLNENANYGRFEIFHPQILSFLNNQPAPTDDHPDQPEATARVIPLGGSVAGTISRAGDLDVFRLDVPQKGWLYVNSTGGHDLIATVLKADFTNLRDARGSNIAEDDVEAGNNEFGIAQLVEAGTYYVSVGHFEPSATTPSGYRVSAKFTNATDNHTALWWVGEGESGWGMNLNQQDNILFASMFNYEAAGLGTQNPGMWLVATARRIGEETNYTGDLLRVAGPGFNAQPFTPITAANSTRVGNLRIEFISPTLGNLTYDVAGAGSGGTGATVTKRIVKQTFGTLPTCGFTGADRSYNNNFQDLWWNPAESGWGINFTHQYPATGAEIIFASMFNYERGAGNANKGLWLVASMPRTVARFINENTPQQRFERTFEADLLRVTGSAFNAVPFVPLNAATNVTKVGTMRAVFTDGNTATLTYDINGVAVTKAITRQVFGEFRPDCDRP